jgi:RecB family endonuclease NucS
MSPTWPGAPGGSARAVGPRHEAILPRRPGSIEALQSVSVRVVIARCSVDYAGALEAHLPQATRLLVLKADGSVLIHSDGGSYKPLNWMSPPCRVTEVEPDGVEAGEGVQAVWLVQHAKREETLRVRIFEILSDTEHDLGVDPGLVKSGVEAQLQELLAEHITTLGEGFRLLRREYPTAIGPVDILCKDELGQTVAVEIKRRGDIDGVEQLTRYLELLNRDPHLRPVDGVFAAQVIRPQARVLATDRGIRCVTLDYEALRGLDAADQRLF